MTQTTKNRLRLTQLLPLLLFALIASPALAQTPGSIADFDVTGAIKSSDGTPYVGCQNCALVRVGGSLWMRTSCMACSECSDAQRVGCPAGGVPMIVDLSVVVGSLEGDFSCGTVDDEWGQTGELTICDPIGVYTVEDVRFTASNLFEKPKGRGKKSGAGTEVVLYLNVERDSSHTAFTLEYVSDMTPIEVGNDRILTATSGDALADLYRIGPELNKKGKPGPKITKTLVGRFSVPFSVTVTP